MNCRGKIYYLMLILVCCNSSLSAQRTRHQIGMNASKFIVLFNEQINNLDISYRYRLDSLHSFRTAMNLDHTSAEEGISDMAFRLGIDRHFLIMNNWEYYYGVEANYTATILKSSNRNNSNYGAFVFIGFLYKFGEHCSISTEPTLALLRYKVIDKDEFGPSANRHWTELKLLNIGQVKLSFHF